MDIKLNSILNIPDELIDNYKIQLNTHYGLDPTTFFSWWNNNFSDNHKISGKCCASAFYAWEKNKLQLWEGLNALAFAQLPYSNKDWLLITAGEITSIQKDGWAEYTVNKKFQPLFGRLIITVENKKGQYYTRKASSILENCIVKEILPTIYSVGNSFPGYNNVCLDFSDLKLILSNNSHYHEALAMVKGVYCLTDKKTGKLYIGSAYGENGIAQRWNDYLNSKHGGNEKLIELYNEKGETYFDNNFQFTLLEYFPINQITDVIIERENYWKKCLYSRAHGFNAN